MGQEIIERRQIDTVVGVYRDFRQHMQDFIKENIPILSCIYTLDAISGGVCSNPLINQKKHIKKYNKWKFEN